MWLNHSMILDDSLSAFFREMCTVNMCYTIFYPTVWNFEILLTSQQYFPPVFKVVVLDLIHILDNSLHPGFYDKLCWVGQERDVKYFKISCPYPNMTPAIMKYF
jgi:hypothetical protein